MGNFSGDHLKRRTVMEAMAKGISAYKVGWIGRIAKKDIIWLKR